LAVEADVDPRSIRREFEKPGSVRGMAGHRIRTVFRKHGLVGVGVGGVVPVLSAAAHARTVEVR
jgi:hypothetical protein